MFPTPDTALTHILVVADPARSKAWYTDVLGATLYREYASSVVLSFGAAWLLLVEGGGPTDDKPGVTLAPPPTRTSATTCSRSASTTAGRPTSSCGLAADVPDRAVTHGSETRCFLRDPDGHLFEISEYRPPA